MNFRKVSSTRAVSDCGQYSIYVARHPGSGKDFHNAWHEPTGKHIAAGLGKAEVKRACAAHAEKVSRETKSEVA